MTRRIDLHVHTTASDGSMSPTEAVRHARELGLSAIAITDHDTVEGLAEGASAGAREGLEVVPGIEVSVDYFGEGIHILGYFIDPAAPSIAELLEWVIVERKRRNHLIADDMIADGVPVDLSELRDLNPNTVIGRPHLAAELVRFGRARSIQDAFDRLLSPGCPYYHKREYIPLHEAVRVIREAGGKAVFAHPLQYRYPEPELLTLTETLVEEGVVGMECLYSAYDEAQIAYLRGIAAHYGLSVTGGSDFHGIRKPHIPMGVPDVPYECLEGLRAR